MAQLHFYVPDTIAEKIKLKADESQLSVSKYMAQLAKREVEEEWPKDYFKFFGQWQGDTLKRPVDLPFENREQLN